jgi:predicted ATP-dependent endonuclease of OLD family/sulfur relay (sulfurtransferase) DsrC/TusE family protein
MRIKKARIQNYKSIIDSSEVSFDEIITALIGKNEQGKTNFLKSLITIERKYSYKNDDLFLKSCSDLQNPLNPIVTLWFTLNEDDEKYFKNLNTNLQDQSTLKIEKFFDNTYNIYFVDSISNNEIQVSYEVWSKDEKKELLEDIEKFLKKNMKLINRKNEENHLRFITSLRTIEGGFRNDMNHPPTLAATYHAISILEKMNSLDRIEKEEIIKYIMSNQDKENGAFRNEANLPPTLESTFYAIMSLEYLNSLNILNYNKIINYIHSYQNQDGGFSQRKQDGRLVESRMNNTYFAVKILKLLNGFETSITDKIVGFILNSENKTGGYGSRPKAKADIASTFFAIAALNEIDDIESIGMIDHTKQFEFIESIEKDNNINLGDLYTFYEVMALDYLIKYEKDRLKKLEDDIKHRILSAENESGGFSYSDKMPQLDSTFYSLYILKTFEDDLEIGAYVDMKKVICDEDKPHFDKILNYLRDYKSEYIVDGDIEVLFKNIKKKYDKKENVESNILDHLPKMVYSDDKMDLLKNSIKIYDYENHKDRYRTIGNLLLISGLSSDVLSERTGLNRRRLTDEASSKITNMLRRSWTQAEIKANIWIDGDEIHFSIEDESQIQVPPTQRSDGFQWFLSFYINFIAITNGDLKDSILLLDNPGLQLHPSGQKDLLSTLDMISNENQIIYTTHSPYLIDIDHLEKVRIIEKDKDNGTIIKQKYYYSSLDSLKPIRDSLGFTLRDSLFISNETIIVEGQSDKYILEGMLRYLRESIEWDTSQIMINSPGGANKIPYYAFFMSSEGLRFAVILDNDSNGNAAARELSEIKRINEKLIIKLDKIIDKNGITIEDLINHNFYNLAVNNYCKVRLGDKLDAEIGIDEIDYNGYGLVNKYNKYFHDKNLGSFDKIQVALEIKKELNRGPDRSIIGEDTIENFQKIFMLIKEALDFKE